MKKELLQYLAPNEERMTFGGQPVVLRELSTAANLELLRDDPDISYRLLVLCVFDASGKQVFGPEDIPALKASSPKRLGELMSRVSAINGLGTDAEIKKSEASPGAAPS